MSKAKKSGFLGGALLGGIIGAASYFLLGTKEGKKTQKKIGTQSKVAYQKAQPTLKKLELEAKKLFNKIKKETQSSPKQNKK